MPKAREGGEHERGESTRGGRARVGGLSPPHKGGLWAPQRKFLNFERLYVRF